MTNLGYQYDWPKRSYPSSKVSVPNTILKMTDRAVSIFEEITGKKIEYRGEAVIVNYYKIRDYMIGHLDDGEIDQVNPIFSFSFGLSCVFLLGYPEK
jgi:alkylated DNA repair protein alkB family protein 1